MIPLVMVMRRTPAVFAADVLRRADDAIEAFLLHRPHEPLRVGVTVWCAGGVRTTRTDTHTTSAESLRNAAAPLRVVIAKQQSPVGQKGRVAGDLAQALYDEGFRSDNLPNFAE